MAIIKSSLLSDIRGSIGGTTYARNKSGLYARNRSKPVNPNTANQSIVRSRLGTLALMFSMLDAASIAAWNQFAQGYPAINRLGDSYTPTGKQCFILCNLNLMSIGLSEITVPPYDIPVVPGCNIGAAEIEITADAGPPVLLTAVTPKGVTSEVSTAVIVYQLTPVMQASRQSYRNRMRQIIFEVQGTNPNASDTLDAYAAYFGSLACAEGQIVNCRCSAVDVDSGVASAWMYFAGIVPTPI